MDKVKLKEEKGQGELRAESEDPHVDANARLSTYSLLDLCTFTLQ